MDIFEKQPADVQDYDVNYTRWLAGMGDTLATAVTTVSPAIEFSFLVYPTTGIIKIWVTGGTIGRTYTFSTLMTTALGRKKKFDIQIKVRN